MDACWDCYVSFSRSVFFLMFLCLTCLKLSAVDVDIVISENPKTYSRQTYPRHPRSPPTWNEFRNINCCMMDVWHMLQGYVGKFLDVTNFPFFLDMSYFVCFFWPWWVFSILCCWEESPWKSCYQQHHRSRDGFLVESKNARAKSAKLPRERQPSSWDLPPQPNDSSVFAIHFQADLTKPNHCQWRQKSLAAGWGVQNQSKHIYTSCYPSTFKK